MTGRSTRRPAGILAVGLTVALVACSSSQAPSRTLQLTELNDSGVTGTATLTDLGDGTTRVVIDVEPGDHPDMPAHLHPGTCDNLVSQPLYPLQNVVNGASDTVVEEPYEDLFAAGLALNIHASNNDFGTYTACANLTE